MKATPNRGYDYPECDPPLVKDKSDIRQVQTLARQIDLDVQSLYDRTTDQFESPDSARVAGLSSASSQSFLATFSSTTYETNPGMGSPDDDSIHILEEGWYFVVGHTFSQDAGDARIMLRIVVNGVGSSRMEGPAFPFDDTTEQESAMSTEDFMFLRAGDVVQLHIRNIVQTPPNLFSNRLAVHQMLRTDA